jgi:hypothetical protein
MWSGGVVNRERGISEKVLGCAVEEEAWMAGSTEQILGRSVWLK